MKMASINELKKQFKQIYFDEFDDPNESFMDFLLDLIPKEILIKVMAKGKNYYSSLLYKYNDEQNKR